jgi:hypothetical protein
MSSAVITQVVEQLETLPDNLQHQVLVFVQTLRAVVRSGIPGKLLLRFAGAIPLNDLQRMEQAIEAGCEQVDPDEW